MIKIGSCFLQLQEFWASDHLGSQFICSGFKDFLQWVVLGRETQSNAQLKYSLLDYFLSIFLNPFFSQPSIIYSQG